MGKYSAIDGAIAATRAWRTRQDAETYTGEKPDAWAMRMSGLDLDPWQRGVMLADDPKQQLLCCRQSGKSTVVHLRAAWIVKHGGKAFCIGPTQRQSSVIFDGMSEVLTADPSVTITRATQTMIETSDGGVGMALPGDRPSSLRGLSLRHPGRSAMLVDETAYIRAGLWPSISPMLAAAPMAEQLWLSTPSGPSGVFYEAWAGDDTWSKTKVTADDCPRISAAFLDQERKRLGDDLFRQEYYCDFVAGNASVFDASSLAAMFGAPEGVTGDEGDVIEAETELEARLTNMKVAEKRGLLGGF